MLLVFSIISVGITIDAFRWHARSSRFPFSAISNLWKNNLDHLSLQERERVRERYGRSVFGVWFLPWLLGVVTLFVVAATVRAFLGQ